MKRNMPIRALIAIALVGTSIAACSKSAETRVVTVTATPSVQTVTQSPTPVTPAKSSATRSTVGSQSGSQNALRYVEAAESGDPDSARAGLKYAAPASPAAGYLKYLAAVAEADLDNGEPGSSLSVSRTSDGTGFRACDDPNDDTTCVLFTDFKVDPSGKVVDLFVNHQRMSPRLTVGNGQPVSDHGVKFTLLFAYESVTANALFIVARLQAGADDISANTFSAQYRSPDGKQRTATGAGGPTDLGANSNSVVYMNFKSVKPGGRVTIEGCVPQSCDGQFAVTLNVGR